MRELKARGFGPQGLEFAGGAELKRLGEFDAVGFYRVEPAHYLGFAFNERQRTQVTPINGQHVVENDVTRIFASNAGSGDLRLSRCCR